MLTIAAKAARYFTVAVYALVCLWFVFGIGSVSAAGGFLVAVPVLLTRDQRKQGRKAAYR